MIKYLFFLIPFLTFSQIDFFKYSTLYTSMNIGTSMTEDEDYISIAKGYEDVTQVNPFDYNLTIGLRKLARWGHQYKVKTWYYGDESNYTDQATIGNATGWEYLLNYSFIRNRGDKYTEQNFWLRYLGKSCVTRLEYRDNQRVDLRYISFDTRYRISKGNFDFTFGGVFRIHNPYGFVPIRDFWIQGEQSFRQLAQDFGYSNEFVNGSWHWFKGDELLATSNDEFYKHYFGQAIADFNTQELDKLGMQKEVSFVLGSTYYKYTSKHWVHIWASLMPFHYGLDEYSYEYGESLLNRLEWDAGGVLGLRVNKHLGLFVEGVHQKVWGKEVFDIKFGFNYLIY